jgi:hypothetical protein
MRSALTNKGEYMSKGVDEQVNFLLEVTKPFSKKG